MSVSRTKFKFIKRLIRNWLLFIFNFIARIYQHADHENREEEKEEEEEEAHDETKRVHHHHVDWNARFYGIFFAAKKSKMQSCR